MQRCDILPRMSLNAEAVLFCGWKSSKNIDYNSTISRIDTVTGIPIIVAAITGLYRLCGNFK